MLIKLPGSNDFADHRYITSIRIIPATDGLIGVTVVIFSYKGAGDLGQTWALPFDTVANAISAVNVFVDQVNASITRE